MIHKFNYNSPFKVVKESTQERGSEFFIEGVAINETITRNGYRYTAEELQKAAGTLIGKPLMKNHDTQHVESIVGKIVTASFENKSIPYKAQVMDKQMQEMIEDGRIVNVSIGAKVDDCIDEEIDGKPDKRVVGLEFLELSLVAVPGDPNATIDNAITESMKGEKMDNKIKEAEPPPVAEPTKEEPKPNEPPKEDKMAKIEGMLQQLLNLLVPPQQAPAGMPPQAPPQAQAAQVEIKEKKVDSMETNEGKGVIAVTENKKDNAIVEGNKTIHINEDGSKFIVERTAKGVNMWME